MYAWYMEHFMCWCVMEPVGGMCAQLVCKCESEAEAIALAALGNE